MKKNLLIQHQPIVKKPIMTQGNFIGQLLELFYQEKLLIELNLFPSLFQVTGLMILITQKIGRDQK